MSLNNNTAYFFGIPVNTLSTDEILYIIESSIRESEKLVVYGYSIAAISQMRKMGEISEIAKYTDISLVDGRPFYWLCKAFRTGVQSPLSIPESVLKCLDIANKTRASVFLFGASNETNRKAIGRIREMYEGIETIYGLDGYFKENEIDSIINFINKKNPDILLIGISSPIKEKIVIEYKDRLNASVIIPCGGMIDVIGEKTKITPSVLKNMGLASFYRLFQEPKRLFKSRMQLYFFALFNLVPTLLKVRLRNLPFNILDHYAPKKTMIQKSH